MDYTETAYINKIVDWFGARGWAVVTPELSGNFTRAILESFGGKMIAKISGPDRGSFAGEGDDAYPLFATWAATQNSPHLPKIYQARSLKRYGLFLTIMEKLDHIPNVSDVEYAVCSFDVDGIRNPVARNAATVSLAVRRKNLGYMSGVAFRNVTSIIIKMVDTFGCLPTDLHAGNIMLRGNTVVITDPYSWVEAFAHQNQQSESYYQTDFDHSCDCSLCNPRPETAPANASAFFYNVAPKARNVPRLRNVKGAAASMPVRNLNSVIRMLADRLKNR